MPTVMPVVVSGCIDQMQAIRNKAAKNGNERKGSFSALMMTAFQENSVRTTTGCALEAAPSKARPVDYGNLLEAKARTAERNGTCSSHSRIF